MDGQDWAALSIVFMAAAYLAWRWRRGACGEKGTRCAPSCGSSCPSGTGGERNHSAPIPLELPRRDDLPGPDGEKKNERSPRTLGQR